MNNAAKKALEKEWKAQQTQLLNERIATEEAVKSELVAALKERLKELKREEAESRKGLPLAERIAKITGYNMADNWYEQANAKNAIKDLTRDSKNDSFAVKDMTLTAQHKYNRETDKMNIARGYGVDGTEVDSWVEAQAKARLTDKGLTKPAPVQPLPPEVIQEIADARAARVKQYVADLTNSNVNSYEVAKYVAIKEQSERVVEQQIAEIQHGFRGRENIQAPKEQAAAPVVELSESQTRAAVAIDARAEAYKETVAEVGVENANAQVTPEVAKDWVAADANDFKQLANEELEIEAAEVISTTAEQVEAYGAALDSQPELVAAVATARELDNDPVYVADPETQFESISPADAAKEDRKAADMDTITPADLAAYDALEAQQADNAAYMNSQADEALAADIQQAAAELGKEPEQQREAVYEINDPRYDTTYRFDSPEKAQAKSEEIGSSRYSEISNEGERTNFVKHEGDWKNEAVVIAAQAAAMEERREAQLAAERAKPAPEQTAEEAAFVAKARADFGMSEEASPYQNSQADEALATDIQQAAAELGREPEQQREAIPEDWNKDPIPENWNQEPAAEIIPEDWNKEAEASPYQNSQADEALAADIQQAAAELGREPEQQREAIPEDWNKDPIPENWNQEPAAEIIPENWNKEAEADPFGAPLEGGMSVDELEATDAAIEAEQQREAIPEDWNKDPIPENWNQEPAAEIIPEDWNKEADPFGAPIKAEQQAEIIPEDWNKDADQDALNTIEPVTERTVETPKAEQVVIDQQTLDNLAKARAADRQAVEEQLGHDSEKAGFVDKPLKENQVESDEILTARKETIKPVLPPEVEREYVNVGNKYYSQKNPETVAFEDKGNKLETRSNNEQVASNLVKIAEARGWDEIKVSGSETFRREVWAEAAARGMHVKGYTPNDQDKANLAKRMVDMEANKVEATKVRDKQPEQSAKSPDEKKRDEIQAARAASFKNDSPETALKKHPELAGAYAAQAAMQRKMEADKLPPQQQAVVQERIRENLVNSIERGQLPEVKRREEVTNKREVSEEREMGR